MNKIGITWPKEQLFLAMCPDCGKVRTINYNQLKRVIKKGGGHCHSCAMKRKYKEDPEYYNKVSEGNRIRGKDPETRLKNKGTAEKCWANPEYREKQEAIRSNPEYQISFSRAQKEGAKKRANNPEWRHKQKATAKKRADERANNPEWRRKVKEANKSPTKRKKQSDSMIKRITKEKLENPDEWERKQKILRDAHNNPEYKQKCSDMLRDPEYYEYRVNHKERLLIGITGEGFWYGHELLNKKDPTIYCEIWKDVIPRIRAFNKDTHGGKYVCEICGEEIFGTPVCHHVFYEKKACCWVTEDGVYTTNLNVRRVKKDAYIIGPNPNYFAAVHRNCHGLTNGKFENRKKWADWLKNKIDQEYGGKSYYTKEEMTELNQNVGRQLSSMRGVGIQVS